MSLIIEQRRIPINFSSGRGGEQILQIILHTYNGKGKYLDGWFGNPIAQVSAQYSAHFDGSAAQYVDDSDTAWHAGNGWANRTSIGIEHQDNGNPSDSVRTPELYETSAQIIVMEYRKLFWDKTSSSYIRKHLEYASTGCPGALDVERIKRRVLEILNPPVDNLYRVYDKGGLQLGAYTVKDNAFNFWLEDKSRKVLYNNVDFTNEFQNMANSLQTEIDRLNGVINTMNSTYKSEKEAWAGELYIASAKLEVALRDVNDLKTRNDVLAEELRICKQDKPNDFNLIKAIWAFIKKILHIK